MSPTSLVLTVFTEALARHGAHEPFSLVVTTSRRPQLPPEAGPLGGSVHGHHVRRGGAPAAAHVRRRRPPGSPTRACGRRWSTPRSAGSARSGRSRRRSRAAARGVHQHARRGGPAEGARVRSGAGVRGQPDLRGVARPPDVGAGRRAALRWDTADGCFAPGVGEAAFASLCNGLRALAVAGPVVHPPPERPAAGVLRGACRRGAGAVGGCQVAVPYDTDHRVDPAAWSGRGAAVEGTTCCAPAVSTTATWRCAGGRSAPPDRSASPVAEASGTPGGGPVEVRVPWPVAGTAFPLGRYPQFELRVARAASGRRPGPMSMDLR